jgi:hypothetical protein
MELAPIRRGLIGILGGLDAEVWYGMRDFVDLVRERAPPKPKVTLEDIYVNFREASPKTPYDARDQLTSRTSDAFHRVEGRYIAWFLEEAPYLAGFVDLGDHNGRYDDLDYRTTLIPPLSKEDSAWAEGRLRESSRR